MSNPLHHDEELLARLLREAGNPRVSPDPHYAEALRTTILDRLNQSETVDPLTETTRSSFFPRSRTTWRWIMRSPVSRVTAAALFVFAVTSIVLWFHSGGTTPAFANFIEPILNAKTVKYKVTTEMKGLPTGTATTVVMMLDARRMRSEMEVEMPSHSKVKTIHIWDGRQGKTLMLHPAVKQATIFTDAQKPKDRKVNPDDPFWFRLLMLDARDKPDVKRESLGEKEIDGRRVVGFRISLPEVVFCVWGDPKNDLPVCIESTVAIMPDVKMTMSDFEFNVDMDESLFSLEPPADYEVIKVQNLPTDDSPPEEKDLIEMFRYYSESSGGSFPDLLDMGSLSYAVSLEEWCAANRAQTPKPMEQRQLESAEAQKKLQRGIMFTILLPKEADSHYAGKGVSLGTPDTPIFWYRPKDSTKYRVIHADLSVREAETPPRVTDTPPKNPENPEQDLIEMLRQYCESIDGLFPNSLDMESLVPVFIMKSCIPNYSGNSENPSVKQDFADAQAKLQRGLRFITSLPKESDLHYAGKGVSLGSPDTPIFWYSPKDATKYRVIYADLSVHDAETPPSVPDTLPEQDLIDMFRYYSESSGGLFPDSLDLQSMVQGATAKPNAELTELTIQYIVEVYAPGTEKPDEERRKKVEELARKMTALQNSASGKENPNEQQVIEITKQILELVDWEKLAPGQENLSEEQKAKLLETRTQKVMAAQMPKILEVQIPKAMTAMVKLKPGSTFVESLSPEADAHYAGKDVSFDTSNTPIFWYRPKDSKTYRVIYADLSVKEMPPEEVEKFPEAEAKQEEK